MNPAPNDKEKRVVPQWLRFRQATENNELNAATSKKQPPSYEESKKNLQDDFELFKAENNPTLGCDILSSSIAIGEFDLAQKVARLVQRSNSLPRFVHDFAGSVLAVGTERINPPTTNEIRQVQGLKKRQFLNPTDAIAWVERARLHAVMGQEKVAIKCLDIAIALDPVNRYVVRSASRYFLHVGDLDRAYQISDFGFKNTNDPWIAATRLSMAQIAKKPVGKIRMFKNFSSVPSTYDYSEFVAAFGMLEAVNGRNNVAKKFFSKAWENPTKNVISHAEWVLRSLFPSLRERVHFDMSTSAEAESFHLYFQNKHTDALKYCREWMFEEPYSERPFNFSSSLSHMLGRTDEAIKMARSGLRANPNSFQLTNSLAYALLLEGGESNIKEASKWLEKLTKPSTVIQKTLVLATSGFYMFRTGHVVEGNFLYSKAVEVAAPIPELQQRAVVYWALAQKMHASEGWQSAVNKAVEICDRHEDSPEYILLCQKLTSNKEGSALQQL